LVSRTVRAEQDADAPRTLDLLRAQRALWRQQCFSAVCSSVSSGRVSLPGANAAWGQNYSRAFGEWIKANGFDAMTKSTRSVAIELHENAAAIEAWRATLPERQRKRLVHPLSNLRRWRTSLNHGNGKCPQDLKRTAMAAWRWFVSCVRSLPADQAAPLWEIALAEFPQL
jgi:hypothetical protein